MRADTEKFLMHYGKKGMHWGVRNSLQKFGERMGERGGLGNAQTQANDRARAAKNKANYKSGKIDRKEYIRRDNQHAMEIGRRIDKNMAAKKEAKKKARLEKAMNKPYNSANKQKHMSTFKKAAIGIGTASAIAISTTLIRNVLNSPSGKTATNRAGEILAMKIAEAKLGPKVVANSTKVDAVNAVKKIGSVLRKVG